MTKERLDRARISNLVDGEWVNSEWEECSILCVVNLDDMIIQIYSSEYHDYDLISAPEETTTEEGVTIRYKAIDTDGSQCYFSFVTHEGDKYISGEWSNAFFMYRMKK